MKQQAQVLQEFSQENFEKMAKKVEESYGPQGPNKINDLHDFYGHNDVIRSPEWMRVVTIMTKAKEGKVDKLGYTFEEVGQTLLEKIKRIRVGKPEVVPAYALKSYEDLCYFVLAIAEFRSKTSQPCPHAGLSYEFKVV